MTGPRFPGEAEKPQSPRQRLYDPVTGAEYELVNPGTPTAPQKSSARALTELQKDRQVERGGKMPDGFGFIPDPLVFAEAIRGARMSSIRIFWYIAARQPWNSLEVTYDVHEIAKFLDRDVAYIAAAMKWTIDDGMLFPIVQKNRKKRSPGVIAMNPRLFWRGFARERHLALQRLHEKGQI